MKTFSIIITNAAEQDMMSLWSYVARHDSLEKADRLIDILENTIQKLSHLLYRGHSVPELERIKIYSFKEIHFKPYRIIYEILDHRIIIHAVLDGRRSLDQILRNRLIRV